MPNRPNSPDKMPRKTHRALIAWLTALALALTLALGLVWWWSGTSGSLGSSLRAIAWLLPAGQSLHASQVQGSLRHGGQVGQLQWGKAGLQLEVLDLDLKMDWSRLALLRSLPLSELSMGQLKITDRLPASDPKALQTLQWPLHVDVAWQVAQLAVTGPANFAASGLRGSYRYNGLVHTLDMPNMVVAQGQYTLQASLQAAAPMSLKAALQGQVQVSGTPRQTPVRLHAQATAQGTLSGSDAQLNLLAQWHPDPATPSAQPMQLTLEARIQPWQKQPVMQAEAQWQHLNLAALWPGMPTTLLTGQSSVTPEGPDWRVQAQLTNHMPGPWDQQALPLSQLQLRLHGHTDQWQLDHLDAQLGGGRIQGQGQQTAAGWTGQIQVAAVQAVQLHTALSSAIMQGHIQAQTTSGQAVSFVAALSAVPGRPKTPSGLHWDQLQLQGRWQASQWDIQALDLQVADAHLQGHFTLQPAQSSAQGQLTLKLPGLNAQAEGLLAPQHGQGQADIRISDATLSMAWLRRWPGWAERLQAWQAQGTGELKVQWQGGYAQTQTPIQVSASLPRLSYQTPGGEPWQVQQAILEVQGPQSALRAQLETRLQHGAQSLQWQSRWSASSPPAGQAEWLGRIESSSAVISAPAGTPVNGLKQSAGATMSWKAQLQDPVAWQGSFVGAQRSARWQAGQLLWQGPTSGQARMAWDAGQWQGRYAGTPRPSTLQRQPSATQFSARMEDLPLAWIPVVLPDEIQSDLLLKGHLKLSQSESLQLRAVLERSRGDLRISPDNAAGQRIQAGLSEARVDVLIDGENAQAQLHWQSEQMGQAQALVQTRLSPLSDGWHWPEQAPVSGWVKTQLPRLGAWSLLAPPGWRVQGTLDAKIDLSGTRAQPQWQGHVQADNLALRSAVQGIEFSQGQLRARVQGQQVMLEQLSLRGAGAQGGELQAQGQLNWLPPSAAAANPSAMGHVNMVLQMTATKLRVSNRADRRLTVSGQVKAQMQQGQLQLRGRVQADQGLFILPEESTPTLGQDVLIVDKRQPNLPAAPPTPSASWIGTPDVQVTLDLGPDFQIEGLGLTTRLAGQVDLFSNASTQGLPRLLGEVRTEGGRYKAYGQQLRIETGLLRFNGPSDNPQLEILAIRPNLSQRVGVRISGTALNPKVRLYSDPDMPDADKLAWLVLGRSAAGGGAESAVLQQAALALFSSNGKTLSGEMANALGLDEISLASGSRSDSTATGAAVTLGKRLSKDFYLVYETSLRGTFGSFYVFYDLSRRLTLRAQTGQDNALDLIYTIRKD
jgi:translocation and assembly module TamB